MTKWLTNTHTAENRCRRAPPAQRFFDCSISLAPDLSAQLQSTSGGNSSGSHCRRNSNRAIYGQMITRQLRYRNPSNDLFI
ncbi:hypothetical protein CISIN_1g046353mg [Citrus sinensis]|uniref:Uncharacterized protein n=1 Tax=Citrus sinensis TaxID=2711 RepID=A0A067EGH1_CITSI|nr:hypothetical protein CISIN_1g046353mg [Citrus sinensis]